MLLGRSQFLLAGIPTGAAIIGFLWLRRRRSKQALHHTDPGGSLEGEEEEEVQKSKTNVTGVEIISLENPKVAITSSIEKGDNFKLSDNITENKIEIATTFEDSELLENLKEDFVTTSENISVETSLIENTTVSTEVSVAESEEKIGSIEVLKLKEVEELLEVEAKEEYCEERVPNLEASEIVIIDNKIATEEVIQLTEEKIDNSVEVIAENTIEQKKEEGPTITSTEGSDSLNKEEKIIEIAEEKEEGAAANMKTGSTQLAEKLASLELDTMKIRDETSETDQKVCTERDSANHSPSEVMLASPSISNFSDAHSEGSSDSGKGHSDVATSPSRTPAGGSSLAGDLAPSIYEFVLPQVIVGRLIGRRGTFLHEIRSSTQTNIYIKRHPDTNKLKICAIEGSQQDIDKALAKIRQKFPLRRFPQLTLEKVSFVTLNTLPPVKLEDFHLQLVEGVNNDVILSSLLTAAHFFLQQPSHPSYSSLGALNQVMNEVYSTAEAPSLETPIKDAVCAAPTMGGWYRAQIVNLDEEAGNSTVRFLDYGGYLKLESSNLRQIRGDLLALPFQGVECYLANVAPADKDGWSEEARLFVHNATVGQVLQAQIYDYAEDGTPLVYLYASYGSQVVLINEELVMRGYGVLTSMQEE